MKFKKSIFILSIILVFSGIVNIWIFMNKQNGYLYSHTDYARLYLPAETPAISGFKVTGRGKLEIRISPVQADGWQIAIDDGKKYEFTGKAPILQLQEGVHEYKLISYDKLFSFSCKIDFFSSEAYQQIGYASPDSCHIISSSIPVACFRRYPVSYFAYNESHYSSEEINEGKKILKDQAGICTEDSTEEKIFKIGTFLINKLESGKTNLEDEIKVLSPLQQYKRIAEGRSGFWCTNVAVIYTFFAVCADIPTRLVALSGMVNDVKLSGHIFTESFFNEKKQWVFIDVNSQCLFIKNNHGYLLNTLDIFDLTRTGMDHELRAKIVQKDKVVDVPYSEIISSISYYFSPSAVCVYYLPYKDNYSLPAKIKRYIITPDLAYSLDNSNLKHYLKFSFFYGWIILAFILLFLVISNKAQLKISNIIPNSGNRTL